MMTLFYFKLHFLLSNTGIPYGGGSIKALYLAT